MKFSHALVVLAFAAGPAVAAEPDGLVLPEGFHATVVAENLGPARHLAIRANGDIYLSTGRGVAGQGGDGIIALRLGPDHKATQVEHFGVVDGGTGIRIWHDALYATSPARVYRFAFRGNSLVPDPEPTVIVDKIVQSKQSNHGLAIDHSGDLFISVDGSDNLCTAPNPPADTNPVGLRPCPDLGVRSGIWRFSASKPGQSFAKGQQVATGIRDITALSFSSNGTLYAFMHGRDNTAKQFPAVIKAADDDNIADEMAVVTKGSDFGWPYSYYDGERKQQLVSPEYGGDGKTLASGKIVTPVLTFQSRRAAPLDMVFYDGKNFPAQYREGVFVALHGTGGQKIEGGRTGHDIVFVPRNVDGSFGAPMVFADGFAGPPAVDSKGRPIIRYRPSGLAVGPDGALYVADSNTGRVWRIAYSG